MLEPRTSKIGTIQELIDGMAQLRPDDVFLISPETQRELTFNTLRLQAHHLYRRLSGMGLLRQDKIAFMMDNGLATAQIFLGLMYGGFVAVPLNVRAGAAQLAYTLNHCQAKAVFVSEKYAALIEEILPLVSAHIAIVPADIDMLPDRAAVTDENPPAVTADDAAMLIYTSGSTGQPKGPIHTHKSILAHGRNSIEAHRLSAGDRSLLVLPLYHINAECVTLIPALLSGGSVVVPHGFSISEFWDWLEEYRCTWSAMVPTIVSQLLDWKDPKAEGRAEAFRRIRFLRSSSGPLSPALHREFIAKFDLPLIQAMGSSETGNIFANPVPPGINKIGSTGLPWGFELKIVDREGAELPAGEPGEVLLRGDAMMQGYYNDDTATAAALDSEGWLHTGDLAYRDADGYLFVVGRSKELIIKAGMNIAPKQIDEALESHPAVLEAASVGVPDRYVGEDLVAFAVLRSGRHCDERELLAFCESRLGFFKTPTRIYLVPDLPKGPSGKVQRLHLVEEAERRIVAGAGAGMDGERPAVPDGPAPAEVAQFENIIAEIWRELLGPLDIGPESNFFALGGQSLQAIQCLSQLRGKTSVLLSLSEFFEDATIARLALRVSQLRSRAAGTDSPEAAPRAATQSIQARDRNLPCLLSPSQERIWFMEQFNTGEPMYNEGEAIRLKGPLNIAVLEQAFNTIIARHEILRMTIALKDDRAEVAVHESWPVTFKKISLRELAADARDGALAALLVDEPRLPYHLEAEPGIRVTLVELAENDHALILMMHHIICDSSSIGVLWRELAAQYESGLLDRSAALPHLPIQYGDYAEWQRRNQFEADLVFWRERLRGAPTLLDQPTDRPRPPVCSFRGTKQLFEFNAALTNDLRQFCRQQQTTLFTVFAAALNTLMYRYTAQEDILIGIPIADRELPELRPLIGFLLDTHVLRTRLTGDDSFQELLARVRQGVAEVYSHRAAPFDQVVAALQPQRDLSHAPVFQVMLNWRDRDDQPQFIGFPGLVSEPLLAHSATAKFDLTIVLTDEGSKILAEIEYSTDLFDESRIGRLVGHLQTLLESAAANPSQKLTELPLLTQAERELLLSGWTMDEDDEVYS